MQVSRSPDVAQIADRAAVEAALHRLQLVDDLHRADLRRARERAGRQAGAQRVHRAAASGRSVPRHRGDDVHHVRVGLDRSSARSTSTAPELAHAARGRCGRGRRASRARRAPSRPRAARLRTRRSSSGRRRPRARAGDRAHLGAAAGHLHQRLRRRARDREVVELEEVHVRRRVDDAQPAVDRERPRPGRARSSAARARPGRRRPRRCSRCARSTAASYCSPASCSTRRRARGSARARSPARPAAGTGSASSSRARSISAAACS